MPTRVQLGIVPAKMSVPNDVYRALHIARVSFQVPELDKPIMAVVPEAHGQKKKKKKPALHFARDCAQEAMDKVVAAAVTELQGREAERRSAEGSTAPWNAVVVAAGCNCFQEEVLPEVFLNRELSTCQTWKQLCHVLSAHSPNFRLPWSIVAANLEEPPAVLLQTNREDS
ncbi:unnamed protein product [Symbiodinium natans]|uniref:Uncharacterized protein n=1 Tax=Symbiodinium natans TaxID=878477 RepID=A0A812G5F1_9DINO|nr:unnamed protein product [Symbiodinium natans]